MSFTGIEHGRLILFRVRDLQPEEQLSPARSHKMTLEPHLVSSIVVNGRPVWPAESLSPEVTRCQTMLTKARCWRPVCVNLSSSSGARSAPKNNLNQQPSPGITRDQRRSIDNRSQPLARLAIEQQRRRR